MIEYLKQPWPWYTAGIIIGLTVPALLLLGNRHFGISANLRHACAAFFPAGIQFFKYDWRKETWNLLFVLGICIGAILAAFFLADPEPVKVTTALLNELNTYGIKDHAGLLPREIFSFESLLT